MIRVAVIGAAGRMGSEVCRSLLQQSDIQLVGGVEASGHSSVGSCLGNGRIVSDLTLLLPTADVVVDFSLPCVVAEHVRSCAQAKVPYVVGVTGLSEGDSEALARCSSVIPIVHSVNFSVGVAVLNRLVSEATKSLRSGYDISILEIHHRHKRDSPSGTARMLEASIRRASQSEISVSVSSVRTGEVVGEHRVIFGGAGERVELVHKAESRATFVTGVIAAIRFVISQKPGLYSIDDLIG